MKQCVIFFKMHALYVTYSFKLLNRAEWIILTNKKTKVENLVKRKLTAVSFRQIDIEFIVSDGSVNTVLRPVINVCACQNQGICTSPQEENADDNDDSSGDRFNILSCVCQNGYTGSLCDADLDACEENFQPCFPGVDCNDLPPPANETGFQCDPCPSGYSGDGIQCLGNISVTNIIFSKFFL